MKHVDIDQFVRGEARYVDDIAVPEGTLSAVVFPSPIACGKIKSFDASLAEKVPGVVAVLTAADIPGTNQIGDIIPDEPLLAIDEVRYFGEPIAFIVAKNDDIARAALKLIKCEIEELPGVFDPREAYQKNQISGGVEIYSLGDIENAWAKCDKVFEGRVDSGGQEHFYFETQRALSIPTDQGGMKISASTQSPTAVQRHVAQVLGLPMNKVEVDVVRIGGGFGGKEAQGARWAGIASLAAFKLKKPVKLVLTRDEDMAFTGKRHAYSSDYKIGFSKDGKILCYEVFFYQNAGAYSDLSLAVLHKSTSHASSTYYVPNMKITGASCLTNIAPATAFRGFGAPQASLVIETAIWKAADELGISVADIQRKNLFQENDGLIYGAPMEHCNAGKCFDETVEKYEFSAAKAKAEKFNKENRFEKKGIALFPLCFGISFDASTFLDQASATVHVYTDGSVSVSTAAIEMGQGVNTKIREIVARTFSISPERVRLESTNTTRIANSSATAASSGADLNGNAAILACKNILGRLHSFAAEKFGCKSEEIEIKDEAIYAAGKKTDWDWNRLIIETYMNKVGLSAHAFYTTPEIFSDPKTKKGRLFAYHVFGTALTEATVDCLRGTYKIDSVKLVHDLGKSLAPAIDIGQVEGALVQGIGWVTSEELLYKNGKPLSTNLATYKIPDIHSAPAVIETTFLEDSENRFGPFNSKAIGEPPLLYGIGSYFAILNAMKSFNGKTSSPSAPLTPEKVLLSLHEN